MGAGPITAEAVQSKPPAPSAAVVPAALPPELLSAVFRLRLQFGERQVVALLAKLGSRIGALDQGGPIRLQVNVLSDEALRHDPRLRKVHEVLFKTAERAW